MSANLASTVERLSLALAFTAFATSWAAAAEGEAEPPLGKPPETAEPPAARPAEIPAAKAGSANHPPGFVRPEPDAVLRLWPGDAPGLVPGGKAETFVNERYANVSVPQLFVYLPPKERSSGTALVICAGGGYGHLAMCLHVENVVRMLNDSGIAVFGLKYRTRYGANDVVTDSLADGKRAVRIVRSRAAEWGIDPRRIGVQGYSAGANLCLNLAGRFDDGDPRAGDAIDRASSRPDFCVFMCLWPNGRPAAEFPLRADSPPAFFAHAKDDTTAPIGFAREIAESLCGLGVPEEMFVVESGGHGAFHWGMVEGPGGKWPEALFPWLERIGAWRRPPVCGPAAALAPEPAAGTH